ncbi:hypothetical protein F5Y09DRAFT_347126 [Xylaria sp. FL1042]|nr:hypothetical protein F5Y09DRAFT_347126 [Xylaria sp. FL1042]
MEVETLLQQLQDTLSQLKTTINELSTKAQNDELHELEQKRERLLADLQIAFQKEKQSLEAKRQTELEEIKKKRKQEDEERAAQRQREDEELKKAKAKEDKKLQQKHDKEADSIEDETERKMDEIEQVAQKKIDEGKKKLQDLDERRKELNRRIDEQLKRSLPISPPPSPRKKNKSKKQTDDLPKNSIDGDSASAAPQTDGSSPKTTNKPDTSSKHPQPPATSSPEKSPEGKKDGELLFQDRTMGPPQAAKTPAENLPRSFSEALRKNLSNESKDKPESEKPSVDPVVQEQNVRDGFGSSIPNNSSGTVAYKHGIEPIEVENVRDGESVENTESVHHEKSGVGKSGDKGVEGLSHVFPSIFQLGGSSNEPPSNSSKHKIEEPNPKIETNTEPPFLGTQPKLSEKHEPNIGESRGEPEAQQRREQPYVPNIDKTISEYPTTSATGGESLEKAERAPNKSHEATDMPKVEGPTVDSKSTIQSPRLSSAFDSRNSRQGNSTHDQVEFEQSTVPDLLKQDRSEDDIRASSETLTRSRSSARPSPAPNKPIFAAPPSPVQSDLVLSLDRYALDMPPEAGNPIGFEHIQNSGSEFLHVIGPQAREKVGSPLPVENETVRGQDQLFDENRSVSDVSEPNTVEGQHDVLPHIPIEGQGRPVLPEPPSKQDLHHRRLTSLIGELDNWAILTEQITEHADADNFRPSSSKSFPVQENEDLKRLDSGSIENKSSHVYDPGKSHPGDNMDCQLANQVSAPLEKTSSSPTCDIAHEAEQSPLQPSYLNVLCNKVLSSLIGPSNRKIDSSPQDGPLSDSNKSKHNPGNEHHPERSRQRGRPKRKSSQSSERALNPREKLFQSSDDGINIRSAWFRHSKRGLS